MKVVNTFIYRELSHDVQDEYGIDVFVPFCGKLYAFNLTNKQKPLKMPKVMYELLYNNTSCPVTIQNTYTDLNQLQDYYRS